MGRSLFRFVTIIHARLTDINAQPAAQLSGHQLTAEEKEVEQRRLGDQHLEKIYRQ